MKRYDKEKLFEMMHKVAGMSFNENLKKSKKYKYLIIICQLMRNKTSNIKLKILYLQIYYKLWNTL